MNDDPSKMLTLAEAAALLGYEPSGLRKIVDRTRKGKPGPQIQFFQIGTGPIKFRREWIDDFVLANSTVPGEVQLRKPTKLGKRLGDRIEIERHWNLAV